MAWIRACGGGSPAVPDGRTVTPINDVTIWQQCAGIANPTYTTLEEVLSDTGILQTLMASDNAVDYLVRSKSFIGTALIPSMTSDSTPSGNCFGDSPVNENRARYKAFDGDPGTFYASSDSSADQGNIGYALPVAKQVCFVSANINRAISSTDVITVVLQASDDGVTFTDISQNVTHTMEASGSISKIFVFIPNDINEHRYYRLHRIAGHDRFWVNQVQFYTASITNNSNAMTYIGQNNYAANTLLADSDWRNAIGNSEYRENVFNVKVPIMTSDTTPSGLVIYSSQYSGENGYKAFNPSGQWSVSSTTTSPAYIGYMFAEDMETMCVWLKSGNASPYNLKLQYSDDNSSWIDTNILGNNIQSVGIEYSYPVLTNYGKHNYWRLYLTASSATYYSVKQLQFYGRKDV